MDCEEDGFDNLNNIRLKGDPILDQDRFNNNIDFENLAKSVKDFLMTVLHEIGHALDAKRLGVRKYIKKLL